MNVVTITANKWNKLKQLYVAVPLVYLLGLSASRLPNNFKIDCYGYGYNNKIKNVVDKVMRYRFNSK